MSVDGRRILLAQGVRAFAYGFTSVLLGITLDARGWSTARVGVLLASVLVGTAITSLVVAFCADRIGRRRCYVALYVALGVTGVVFALTSNVVVLCAAALLGALSTEVLESGPFSSLEQAMLPGTVPTERRVRMFGTYSAVATVAGSFGALAAGGPALLRDRGVGVGGDQRFFLVLVPAAVIGVLAGSRLTPSVEGRAAPERTGPRRRRVPLDRSRRVVLRLAGLFAVDSFGGGFAVQSFLVFFLSRRFGFDAAEVGLVFFVVGFLQAGSFWVATRLAQRIGLLNTMVFTHLPSNLLLIAVAFAPNGTVAVVVLFARFALSQMDVPTRQAYVVALVDEHERVAAAAVTSTAKCVVRPVAPVLAGALQQISLGLPLVIAGTIKSIYDLALWAWLRHVPLADEPAEEVHDDRLLEDRARSR